MEINSNPVLSETEIIRKENIFSEDKRRHEIQIILPKSL